MIKIMFFVVIPSGLINCNHYHIAKLNGQSNIALNDRRLPNALRKKWMTGLKRKKRR